MYEAQCSAQEEETKAAQRALVEATTEIEVGTAMVVQWSCLLIMPASPYKLAKLNNTLIYWYYSNCYFEKLL